MSPAFRRRDRDDRSDREDGGARAALRPAGRGEEGRDTEERDERDPGRGLRRDAHDADDARRDRDEQHAEHADARTRRIARCSGAMSPANTPGTRPATSTTSATPPNTKLPGRSRSVRAVAPPPTCVAVSACPRATDVNASSHRRQASQHREDARGGHGTGADVANVARPDVAGVHVDDQSLRFRIERLRHRRAHPGDERRDHELPKSTHPPRKPPPAGSRGCNPTPSSAGAISSASSAFGNTGKAKPISPGNR